MSKYMTKKQTISLFLSEYNGPHNDKTWKRCAWLDFVDAMCKDGQVSQSQYDNWSNPFKM